MVPVTDKYFEGIYGIWATPNRDIYLAQRDGEWNQVAEFMKNSGILPG